MLRLRLREQGWVLLELVQVEEGELWLRQGEQRCVLLELVQVEEGELWLRQGEQWLRQGEQSCVLLDRVVSLRRGAGEQRLVVGCGVVSGVVALGGTAFEEPTGGLHEPVVVAS